MKLNDDTDYGLCFACGPRNKVGLNLRFERHGATVTTTFCGRQEHQGFPGYLHGGIITALLDEVMSRVSLLENRWTMTARMEVRFRRPIPIDQQVTAIGEQAGPNRRLLQARGKVILPDGSVAADAVGTFVFLDNETLAEMSADYPTLTEEWMRL